MGFTTIELLTVLVIIAILAGIAAPSFRPMLERWRVRNASEAMVSAVYYARSEAIKRGGNVKLQKIANNTDGCTLAATNEDWGCGWGVYSTDTAGTATLLKTFAIPANVTVSIKDNTGSIPIDRWGTLTGVSTKGIAMLPAGGSNSSPAAVGLCIAAGGRIKVIGNPPC
ncbi:MAG: GspH/FimT family pseudopilin [Burkholderiaceae bacterium]|nr:GspH/FimT family pseudopilin [Burkholderiaceae bacterium]